MPSVETSTRKIVARLQREGWIKESGGKHDKYKHVEKPGVLIVVPRHAEQSMGVARSSAKSEGWR
jgi:predicted RNA binding protein YcfA (HicA-like mRNA interferase family)